MKIASGKILHDDQLARLLTFPNVLNTAHQTSLTGEALAEIARVTASNLIVLGDRTTVSRRDRAVAIHPINQ